MPLPLGHVRSLVGPEPQDYLDWFLPNHAERFLAMPVQVKSLVHGKRLGQQFDFGDAVGRKGCEAIAVRYPPHAVKRTGDVQQPIWVVAVRFRSEERRVGKECRSR